MKTTPTHLLAILMLGACCCSVHGQILDISKTNNYTVPVAVSGFEGEVDSVLKFDLSVLGMEITTPDKAQYLVSGTVNGRVQGSFAVVGTTQAKWSKGYAGGSLRLQAHAFANDIAAEIRGTAPIFLTRIAFRIQQGRSTEIAESDFDGYHATVLTRDGALVETPTWMPGGHALLYTTWKQGGEEILEQNVSTGERRIFANYHGANLSPEVSPDGSKVAMILSRGGYPNLWVRNVDGSGLKQLTHTSYEDSSPTWSPDGREICFVCRSGRPLLQKISAGGGAARTVRVSGAGENMTSPDWSPDGKWIAFTSGSGNFTICVVPAEGGEAQRLVAGEDPCWAPNSRTIVFSRRVSSDRHILSLLDVPTKHVKDVREISGSCSEPSWAR